MTKRDRMDLQQAQACIAAYRQIPVKLVEIDLSQALVLSARFRMYAYDAYLLVCAMQHRAALVSLDGALNTAAEQMGITVLRE